MFKSIITLTLSIFLCSFMRAGSTIKLSDKGKTEYKIVFDEQNSISAEKTSALELKNYLKKISGADFPVLNNTDARAKIIVLGHNKLSEDFLGSNLIKGLGEEEFIIKSTKNGNIYIVGGRPRGTLYGVYHFLDNIIGVRWLAPDVEFVPDKASLTIPALDVRENPAYVQRDANYFIHTNPQADYRWLVRNRFNHTKYDLLEIKHKLKQKYWVERWGIENKIELPYLKYGMKELYAPPYFCHTMARLIPDAKYFKKHPEWWEEIDGKRINRGKAAAMCLSNQGLIDETAKNAIAQIDKYPESKIVSISENDGIAEYCKCPKCRALMKKYSNAESGLLLNFVNQVAEKIHKKYPDIMVETLAYMKTENPPKNIKAGKNILVRLCAWVISHAIPYNDPISEKGKSLLEKLKEWKTVCPNMGIWDYPTTYYLNFTPHPNLHTIIPNLKAFYKAGVRNYFFEGDHNEGGYRSGESLARAFLLSRGLWNPNSNSIKLIKDFTDAYYGKAAGKYVREYWKLLENSNRKANYIVVYQSGNVGEAPYLQLSAMLQADKLLKKAMQVAKNKQHKEHVQQLHMQIAYVLLCDWRKLEKEAKTQQLKMPGTFDAVFADFEKNTEKFKVGQINYNSRQISLATIKKNYYQDFSVCASKCYGSKPEDAFDENLKTYWNGSDFSGWLEIKFKKNKLIKSIHTVFGKDTNIDYTILGSMDGKKWQTLVPRKIIDTKKIINTISAVIPVLFADDEIKPVKVLYVKTKIFKATSRNGKPNWVVIYEQTFNDTKK